MTFGRLEFAYSLVAVGRWAGLVLGRHVCSLNELVPSPAKAGSLFEPTRPLRRGKASPAGSVPNHVRQVDGSISIHLTGCSVAGVVRRCSPGSLPFRWWRSTRTRHLHIPIVACRVQGMMPKHQQVHQCAAFRWAIPLRQRVPPSGNSVDPARPCVVWRASLVVHGSQGWTPPPE